MTANTMQLGSVADILSGFAFKSEWFQNAGTPVIRIGDICDEKINTFTCVAVDENSHKIPESCRARNGDILMALSGATTGKIGVVRANLEGALVNQRIAIIRSPEPTTQQYIQYVFTGHLLECLLKRAWGAAQANLSPKALRELEIPIPPLEEQRRIAAILDKADAVRRKRQEAIALTEDLLRSAFLEMFGDPVTNPKRWEVVELQQVCHRVTDGTHQPPKWATEGIPFLFVSNIVNGEIDFNVSKYINDKSWASLTARCPIEVNDILYTTVGSYGNAALVCTKKQFCFQRHIAHIKPNPDKIHPEFLLGLMQSEGVKKQADRQVRGVAQKTLNLRELKKFQIAVPPRIYQEQYVAFRKKIGSCRNNQQNCFKTQDALFNSLLQRAFRGEL